MSAFRSMKDLVIGILAFLILATIVFVSGMIAAVILLRSFPELINVILRPEKFSLIEEAFREDSGFIPVAPVVSPEAIVATPEAPAMRTDVEPREPTRTRRAMSLPEENGIMMTAALFTAEPIEPILWDRDVAGMPAGMIQAILNETNSPENAAFMAAAAYAESSWRITLDNADGKGPDGKIHNSVGAWQIHRGWGSAAAKYADEIGRSDLAESIRRGYSKGVTWEDNLRAFRAFVEIQKEWRQGKDSFSDIAAYYNDGANGFKPGSAGQKHARKILAKQRELLPTWESIINEANGAALAQN